MSDAGSVGAGHHCDTQRRRHIRSDIQSYRVCRLAPQLKLKGGDGSSDTMIPGFGFGFDITYLLFMIPGLLLGLWAQHKVKSTFERYAQVATSTRVTGEMAAERLIRATGLNVQVAHIGGALTDHYDPRSRTVALSQTSTMNSVASVAVVAHELGHALQHAQGDVLLRLRGVIVPIVNLGSGIAPWLFMVGALLGLGTTVGSSLAWLGVIGFGLSALFALLTLPVEFDASRRALAMIRDHRLLTESEMGGAKKVLDAAALTYVAAAAQSLLTLLYFVLRLTGASRRDE